MDLGTPERLSEVALGPWLPHPACPTTKPRGIPFMNQGLHAVALNTPGHLEHVYPLHPWNFASSLARLYSP